MKKSLTKTKIDITAKIKMIGAKNLKGLKYMLILKSNLKNPKVSLIGLIFDFPTLEK